MHQHDHLLSEHHVRNTGNRGQPRLSCGGMYNVVGPLANLCLLSFYKPLLFDAAGITLVFVCKGALNSRNHDETKGGTELVVPSSSFLFLSYSPSPSVYMPEIMPTQIRGKRNGLPPGSGTGWLVNCRARFLLCRYTSYGGNSTLFTLHGGCKGDFTLRSWLLIITNA
jgi:hypothetical protein